MHTEWFEVAERFRGPPRSGNGGYVCGRIARNLPGTVATRLKAPPPLGKALRLESTEDLARLFDGETLIGEARPAELDITPPAPTTFEQARIASLSFVGFKHHPFPGCFVCGPERTPLDGLRIFPGAIEATTTLAAPWTPDASLADETGQLKPEFIWSALDCTGGFAVFPAEAFTATSGTAFVLGELCVRITHPPQVGQGHIVMGWPLGHEGRKRTAGSAIYTAQGQRLALARALWIEVPLSAWG